MNRTLRIAVPMLLFVLGAALVRLGSPPRIQVMWETASEVDAAGFHLYRSQSRDGPFVRITEAPIPARGDPLTGTSYSYEDRDVSWGQSYFYRLAEVELAGGLNRYDRVVEGRAGAGWAWALTSGALLAAMGGVAVWSWPRESQDREPALAPAAGARCDWTLDVGGVSLTLTGPDEWIESLSRNWRSWSGAADGWSARLVRDAGLAAPSGPLFAAPPRFVGGRCLLEAPGFAGEIAPDEGRALLRAHPAAQLEDLAYFVRTAFALEAFDRGGLLFHAAGIVHRGAAYAFFGRSGSGKTTAARLSAGKPVLNDDLLLLRPGGDGWESWGTPFGRRRVPEVRSAPLRALVRLEQGVEERLVPLARGRALGELVANSPVANVDPARSPALLARCEAIRQAKPVILLHFRKSDAFWEVIDAYFG